MTVSTKILRPALLALLFFSVSFACAEDWQTRLTSVPLNQAASHAFSKHEKLDGHPALLQFWASWCQSCGGLMFDLEKLRMQHSGLNYVAISVDSDVKLAKQAELQMLSKQFRAPHLFDIDKKWAQKFSVISVPTIVLLDASGALRFRHEGHLDAAAAMQLNHAIINLESSNARVQSVQE